MANYNCVTRTNYFRVKDEAKFEDLMAHISSEERICFDEHTLWKGRDSDGNAVYGFGIQGSIYGVDTETDEEDYNRFLDGLPDFLGDLYEDASEEPYDLFVTCLQACVADDDAIILFEAGYEGLRYVVGSSLIITSEGTDYIDITSMALKKAKEMLKNGGWATRCDY